MKGYSQSSLGEVQVPPGLRQMYERVGSKLLTMGGYSQRRKMVDVWSFPVCPLQKTITAVFMRVLRK